MLLALSLNTEFDQVGQQHRLAFLEIVRRSLRNANVSSIAQTSRNPTYEGCCDPGRRWTSHRSPATGRNHRLVANIAETRPELPPDRQHASLIFGQNRRRIHQTHQAFDLHKNRSCGLVRRRYATPGTPPRNFVIYLLRFPPSPTKTHCMGSQAARLVLDEQQLSQHGATRRNSPCYSWASFAPKFRDARVPGGNHTTTWVCLLWGAS